ncbi:MAG TPA: serine/threonine-protein kinase [Acidimicrobiales bacterium]|nr:serine/threonine-protein kinase [Acidimicrobiales bacterium]
MGAHVAEGQVLAGRYRLGPLLGRGGMAEVFDAFDLRLDRPVAVKLLRPDVAAHPSMRERFEREARSAARLSHPNVVSVYDSGEEGALAFLVMERLPGRSLADMIGDGPLDQRQVVAVSDDVLAALHAAHAIGLVHRDIKPANILLAGDGRAKVADFGIAKSVEMSSPGDPTRADLTQAGLVIGTPSYLAPERREGHPATAQSDLYAVGVVMFEALTGRKPLAGTPFADAGGMGAQAGTAAPDVAALRPDVAPWLAAVVSRALSARPESRYESAAEMRQALVAGAGGGVAGAGEGGANGAGGGVAGAGVAGGAATHLMPPGTEMLPSSAAVVAPTDVQRQTWPGPPGGPSPPRAPGAPGPPSPRNRRRLIGAVVALVVVVAVVTALLMAGGDGSKGAALNTPPRPTTPGTGTASTTSTTPSATTLDPQAAALDQAAQNIRADGTPGATILASLLQSVGAQPAGAARAAAAQQVLAQAQTLLADRSITQTEYQDAATALQAAGATAQAPSTSTPAPSTTAPAPPTPPAPGPGPGGGDKGGKGKGPGGGG